MQYNIITRRKQMKRISKTYRLSIETIEKIEKLRKAEPEKKFTATDIIEIAIKKMEEENERT
jgi:hypothetical protein